MKKYLIIICMLAFIGTAIGVNVDATDSADVSATVTIAALSIASIAPTTFDYGSLGTGDSKDYLATTDAPAYGIKVTNGSTAADLKIKGADTTGGSTAWTLGASAGINAYVHNYKVNAGTEETPDYTGDYTALTASNQALFSNVAADESATFNLQVETPTTSSEVGVAKTLPVTVIAVAPGL